MSQINVPNPGSFEAELLGCLCPVIDNQKGKGAPGQYGKDGSPLFWIVGACPLHGFKEYRKNFDSFLSEKPKVKTYTIKNS